MNRWQARLLEDDGMSLLRCATRDSSQVFILSRFGQTIVEWNEHTGKPFAVRYEDYQAFRGMLAFFGELCR